MTNEQLNAHIEKVAREFKGDLSHLSSAIGAVTMGNLYGWKVLRLVTSSVSYRRHQKILGLDFKEVLPDVTELSSKSYGYNLVVDAGKYWDTIQGKFNFDGKTAAA